MNSQNTLPLAELERRLNDVEGNRTIDLGGAVVNPDVDRPTKPVALTRPDVVLKNGTIHLAPGQWLRVDADRVTFEGLNIGSSSTGGTKDDDVESQSKPGMVTVSAGSFTMLRCKLICKGSNDLSAALKVEGAATSEGGVTVDLQNCTLNSDVKGCLVIGNVKLKTKSCNMSGLNKRNNYGKEDPPPKKSRV